VTNFRLAHLRPLVTDDLRLLFELLEPDPLEVRGHAAATVSSELGQKLAKFAAGKSTEEERDEMKKMLREKPELVPVLAEKVRALRQTDQ